jgi:hypothetical protein
MTREGGAKSQRQQFPIYGGHLDIIEDTNAVRVVVHCLPVMAASLEDPMGKNVDRKTNEVEISHEAQRPHSNKYRLPPS